MEEEGQKREREGWMIEGKRQSWKREQAECAAEINSARNAKLIKKKTSAQTKFIWVIRSDKERGRD